MAVSTHGGLIARVARVSRIGLAGLRWSRFVSGLCLLACLLGANLLGASPSFAQQLVPVPPLKARVTDLAGLLQPDQLAALEAQLKAIEDRKGSQVAVLIVPTTGDEDIAQYSIRVVESWQLGRGQVDGKAVDDGLLILIATRDRKLRIEVGYGLEGAVPDAMAKRIISQQISPSFKQGDYFGGLQRAVASVSSLIDGEPLPEPQPRQRDVNSGDWFGPVFVGFILGMIAIGIVGRFLGTGAGIGASGVLASLGGATIAGTIASVIATFLMLMLIGGGGGRWRRVGPHTYRRGGFGGGLGGGFGGGFGGGGGGGFGGGGGGFGGGGASGGW
ncbi:MAG: TPM domain-containing protein [Burkholderiaceae bacterium]